jgi:acyl carrier protein
MATIAQRVTLVVAGRFPGYDIRPDSDFFTDLGADSLAIMELVMDLEDEFGINIPESHISGVRTIAEISARIGAWAAAAEDTGE